MLRTTSRRSAPSKLSTTPPPVCCTGGPGGSPPPGCMPFTMTPVPLKMRAVSPCGGWTRPAASASPGERAEPLTVLPMLAGDESEATASGVAQAESRHMDAPRWPRRGVIVLLL